MDKRDKKLEQLTRWAKENSDIRAMLLTSSLASPHAPVDDFSDLDIELVFEDTGPYCNEKNWLLNFGTPVAIVEEDESAFDGKHAMKMVLYDDYVKVDFKIYNKHEFLKEINSEILPGDWDVGYKIVLDKDRMTQHLKPPTYQSVIITRPTKREFEQLLNDFWWDTTYVAKCLARDEIFYAKFMSENVMRTEYLVPLIEWHIGIRHDWNVTTNKHGRLFKQHLPNGLWQKIEATFSGSSVKENWKALWAHAGLVHQLGTELATALGYTYPEKLESEIRAYLEYVRSKNPAQPD